MTITWDDIQWVFSDPRAGWICPNCGTKSGYGLGCSLCFDINTALLAARLLREKERSSELFKDLLELNPNYTLDKFEKACQELSQMKSWDWEKLLK